MNRCSIITIITIKITTRYCLLQFKGAIKPLWFWSNLLTKKDDWECLELFLIRTIWLIQIIRCSFQRSLSLLAEFLEIVIDIRNNLLCLWPQSLSLCHLYKHERKCSVFTGHAREQIMNKIKMYFSTNCI